MNKAEFREYLKNEAFNFVNRRYNEWNRENPNDKWTEEQMAVVEKFVNGRDFDFGDLVNNIIDRMGNMVITERVIQVQRNRLLIFLSRLFDENHNNPEGTVWVISITSPLLGGKKSRKSRKSRKSKKIKKIKEIEEKKIIKTRKISINNIKIFSILFIR